MNSNDLKAAAALYSVIGDPHASFTPSAKKPHGPVTYTVQKGANVFPSPQIPARWLYGRMALVIGIASATAITLPILLYIGCAVGRIAYQHITGVPMSP